MDKIKVSKEVATALDTALKKISKEKLLERHSCETQWISDVYLPLNQISIWEMAQILINGYELEETPEEKILQIYKRSMIDAIVTEDHTYENGYARGSVNTIPRILKALDITIKGIND